LTISAGVGDGVASTIFIVHESLQDGFDLLLTVIVTVPTFFAVTTPEELTVAMDVSLELHSSVLSEAFVGFIVTVSLWVLPTASVEGLLLILT